MILLDENTPWPEVWAINPGTGLREPKPQPLIEIVGAGYDQWYRDNGKPPQDLLVSILRRREFMRMFNESIGMPNRSDLSGASQFMGLRVLWAMDGGIRLA